MSARIYHPKDDELFQRKLGGSFYIWHEGRELCLETSDYKEARAAKEYHRALSSTYGAASFSTTFGRLFPEYIKHRRKEVEQGRRRSSYIESIEWYWGKYLKEFWEKKRLVDFHQVNWDKFCEWQNKQKIDGRRIKIRDFTNHRSTMTGFLRWASRKRFILAIPTVENPHHVSRRRKQFTPEHITLLFKHVPTVEQWRQEFKGKLKKRRKHARTIPGGLRLFMALYLFHGSRRGENIRLRWSDVDFEKRAIILRPEVVKTGEGRVIPINKVVFALLQERRILLGDMGIKTAWVFPNTRDISRHMTDSGFKGAWGKLLVATGLERYGYTWHDFRATFESFMDKTGGFTETQREKMSGAAQSVRSKRYVGFTVDDLRGLEEVVQVPGLTEIFLKDGDK